MEKKSISFAVVLIVLLLALAVNSCRTSSSGRKVTESQAEELIINPDGGGAALKLSFTRGKSFNHPTFVIWLEDTTGSYLQTLFVTRSFGTGTFQFGDAGSGQWKPGQVKRPAALPYWSHKTGESIGSGNYIPDAAHPMPDAITAATPKGSFRMDLKSGKAAPRKVRICLEINQTWDWNNFWTNDKYPDDPEYRTSSQPALVYSAVIDLAGKGSYTMQPIGRSSHSGADGKLYTDLGTLTSALRIAEKITVMVAE
jgi:hypothetical protein